MTLEIIKLKNHKLSEQLKLYGAILQFPDDDDENCNTDNLENQIRMILKVQPVIFCNIIIHINI